MASNKIVSVIIPTKNRSNYIEAAINSVLEQDLPLGWKLEIVVIDDGSTDNTISLLKKYDKKIQIICQESSGAAVARNHGISKAKGDYIAFLDSDDLWMPDKLKAQLPYFEDPKIDMVHGLTEVMNKDGVTQGRTHVQKNKVIPETTLKQLLESNVIATSTCVIRKSVLLAAGSFDESGVMFGIEDYGLWLRVATQNNVKILALDKVLSRYREHDQNLSNIGFDGLSQVDFQVKALQRILGVYEHILFSDKLTDSQIKEFEDAIALQVDRIATIKNPNFVGRTPTVSVILPAYNAENFIRQTIESILSQTFRDFELLIFDDGSKDKTAEVIRSFNDPRIKFYRQRNMGLLDTCNKGIRLARAPLIARHDADDISLPSRFEKEVILLTARPEVGLVSTYFTYMDEHSEAKSITMAYPFKSIDVKRSFYSVNSIAHGGAMIRKSVLEEVGGYPSEFTPAEDYHLWTKIAEVSEIAIIPESLYWYRISSGGMAATRYDELIVTAAGIAEEYWKQKFKSKRLLALLKDARYYRTLDSPYSQLIYEQYLAHQKFIRSALYQKRKIFSAMKMSIALIFIDLKPLRKTLALYRRAVKKAYRMTVGRKRSKINR